MFVKTHDTLEDSYFAGLYAQKDSRRNGQKDEEDAHTFGEADEWWKDIGKPVMGMCILQ